MKRCVCVFVAFLLSSCLAQTAHRASEPVPQTCGDRDASWTAYEAAKTAKNKVFSEFYLACAAHLNHPEAMAVLGRHLVQSVPTSSEFEKGLGFLRLSAIAGNQSAQTALSETYHSTEGWMGRNAYLAIFWESVASDKSPARVVAETSNRNLVLYWNSVGEQGQFELGGDVKRWRPGLAEPALYTIDSWLTLTIDALETLPPDIDRAILEYGQRQGFPDWKILTLVLTQAQLSALDKDVLVAGLAAQGGYLGLSERLNEAVKATKGPNLLTDAILKQIFVRFGLDPKSIEKRHYALQKTVRRTLSMRAFARDLSSMSELDRHILATLTAYRFCYSGNDFECDEAMDILYPYATPAAKPVLRYLQINRLCRHPELTAETKCFLKNGGFGFMRKIIIDDVTLDPARFASANRRAATL